MAWILAFLLLLYVVYTEPKLISLRPGWEAYAENVYRFSNGDFYYLRTSDNTTITSFNSTFALGLFSSDFSTTMTMIICLLPFNSSMAIEVWNVGKSMTQNNIVLRVPRDKSELQLLDADYNVIWSLDSVVSALELTESGNLIVYNSSQNIIWQSFDYPTDTFLPGQTLKQGTQLTSSNSSHSGNYSLVVEPSAVVLYSNDADPPLPYWVYTIEGTSDYSMAMQKCGLSVTYIPANTTDIAFFNGSSCNQSNPFRISVGYSSIFTLIRLDSDGNLRHYVWKEKMLSINSEVFGQDNACSLPNICGSYGVCSKGVHCTCPNSSLFTSDSTTKGCRSNTPLVCDASSRNNQIFFNVSNVTYFSNRFVAPLNWRQKDDYVSSCLSNCSCLAAFYEDSVNQSSSACYHVSTHLSSLQIISANSQKNYLAYLKVQLSTSHSNQNSISKTVIFIVVGVIVVTALAGLLTWWFCHKKSTTEEDAFLTTVPGVPLKFSLKNLEVATNGFQCKLGEGGFGPVFGGTLKDGRTIAVKRLESAQQGQREFEAEVRTLGGVDHINLVRLYGFCLEGLLLVYECMPNGSLDKWLFVDEQDKVLSWSTRMAIAMDIAQGLAYLQEGCSRPVLHLDIKPQNILLGEDFKAKVSDLGMAKLLNHETSTVTTQIRGTPGYLAPELPAQFMVSKKCDVYSYGIVLLEIISGRRVFSGSCNTSDLPDGSCNTWYLPYWVFMKIRSGNIMDIVDPRLNGDFEHEKAEQVIRLGCSCIHENADNRPAMPHIIQVLQGKVEVPESTFTEPQQPMMHLTTNINSGYVVTVIEEAQHSVDMLSPR